jgi:2-methylisocitrate lyase-like PEP mutase family enzyme
VDPSEQRARAEQLRSFHRAPPILVLPNAWDVSSARAFASIPGCRAIATTSAGVAESLGYEDGEGTPVDEMLAAVSRIAHAVPLPVTADLEAGYGDPESTAAGAIEAGAVGLNFEDGAGDATAPLADTHAQAERVAAIRAVADREQVPLVINARTDVFLAGVGKPAERVELAAERGRAYLAAGADCVFVPGIADAETIAAVVRAVDGPVSILARRGTPSAGDLERMGVVRVSVGSNPFRTTLDLVERIGTEILGPGTFESLR